MNFVLKPRKFITHCILFFVTGGIWLIIYICCYIYNKRKTQNIKENLYQTIYDREQLQYESDLLDIEIKKEKLKELQIKNRKNEKH